MIRYDIEKFNQRLKDNSQTIQALSISVKEIIFSNGFILNKKNEIVNCKRRSNSHIALIFFDKLYNIDPNIRKQAEIDYKSERSRSGGYATQKLHGDNIVENLKKQPVWNKGMKGNYPYSHPCSDEAKKKISLANSGERNGMYGKKMSYEEKEKLSKIMKEKILSGEFTPNSNNRNTYWDAYYNNKKYRSSWEALYASFDNYAEYETLRISYIDVDNNERIYIVDFVNHINRQVIEVKPSNLVKKSEKKINALKNWCYNNNYNLIIADENFLMNLDKSQICVELFDENTFKKIERFFK